MADATGGVAKRTRRGLKLQGEAKKKKRDEPPAPEELKPLSERYGSSCPVCYEEWDVNNSPYFRFCCARTICEKCDEKIFDDDPRAPCPLCRAPVLRDDAPKVSLLRGHALRDVPEAITELAAAYRKGYHGLKKDFSLAVKHFKRAVALGDVEAMVHLGAMYHKGEGVTRDERKAMQMFRSAADRGYACAQKNVGVRLEKEGGEHNAMEAVHFYRLAAAQGLTEAEERLGNCYRKGVGVDVNFEEARRWYARAAAKGSSFAQCCLGNLYYAGEGVGVDFEEAKRLYLLAAAQGDAAAERNIAGLYEDGLGVDVDLEEAKRWYERAASQGHEFAIASIPRIERKLERKLVRAAARKLLLAVAGDVDAAVEALRHAESDSDSVSESDPDHSA